MATYFPQNTKAAAWQQTVSGLQRGKWERIAAIEESATDSDNGESSSSATGMATQQGSLGIELVRHVTHELDEWLKALLRGELQAMQRLMKLLHNEPQSHKLMTLVTQLSRAANQNIPGSLEVLSAISYNAPESARNYLLPAIKAVCLESGCYKAAEAWDAKPQETPQTRSAPQLRRY